jgi:zinc protease
MSEMEGISWRYLNEILVNVQKVTSKDIQAVVAKYFVDDQLTIAILDPQIVDANKSTAKPSASSGMRH